MDVTLAWAAIIAFGLLMYVVLDGFDLGVGLLFPLFPDDSERDMMMHSVAPVWDGNETWLVLGGAALFAAFPVVYSVVLSALYLPIVTMLVCLILRGVSFEFRGKATRRKNLWSLAFFAGSAGASFFQGVILGAYLRGIPVVNGTFAGDSFFWLQPFSLICGWGLMATYALLGACWLVIKTDGNLQWRMRELVLPLTSVLLCFMAAVSVWTPLTDEHIAHRWFGEGLFGRLLWVPVLVAVAACLLFGAVKTGRHVASFVFALVLVLLGYVGLLVSIWPYAIPFSLTVVDAAAPLKSQIFTLIGAVVILPIILAYTTAGYWIFRGKVERGAQYH